MKTAFQGLMLTVFVSICPLSAAADWEAKVKVLVGQKPPQEGVVRVRKTRLRLEVQKPLPVNAIVDVVSGKAWVLLPMRMYSETSFEKTGVPLPKCSVEKIDDCLKKQGFQKKGQETVLGHACNVFESANAKIWRPRSLPEVLAVKIEVKEKGKEPVVVELNDIKTSAQGAALFELPPGSSPLPAGFSVEALLGK